MISTETKEAIRIILTDMKPYLDEKQTRLLYGSAAKAIGYGGVTIINEITGSTRNRIYAGIDDLSAEDTEGHEIDGKADRRIRRPGGGRKSELEKNPQLYEKIEEIVTKSGDTYGNPEKPLRWTTWSLRKIAKELLEFGIKVSQNIVSRALEALGYTQAEISAIFKNAKKNSSTEQLIKFALKELNRFA